MSLKEEKRGENAMAGKSIACSRMEAYYQLPSEDKLRFIKTDAAVDLLSSMPGDISGELVSAFLSGESLSDNGGRKVVDYFRANSRMVPDLAKFPGTYSMLEKMYFFEEVSTPIDRYFGKSLPGGVSLESRFRAVNEKAVIHIREILAHQKKCLVLDLGSGPGRNGITLTLDNPDFADRVEFHCIDTDPAALAHGERLIKQYNLHNIKYVEKSMAKLHRIYRQSADYGLIIGVLCGLSAEERKGLLKIMRPYFNPGARVIGAGLLDKMLELDFFCSYLLRETTGWVLQHPSIGQIQKAYEDAGYAYEGYFQEEPTRCYEIGIGIA